MDKDNKVIHETINGVQLELYRRRAKDNLIKQLQAENAEQSKRIAELEGMYQDEILEWHGVKVILENNMPEDFARSITEIELHIKEMRQALSDMNWTNVEDALPEVGQEVKMETVDGHWMSGYLSDEGYWHDTRTLLRYVLEFVARWCPLPEAESED